MKMLPHILYYYYILVLSVWHAALSHFIESLRFPLAITYLAKPFLPASVHFFGYFTEKICLKSLCSGLLFFNPFIGIVLYVRHQLHHWHQLHNSLERASNVTRKSIGFRTESWWTSTLALVLLLWFLCKDFTLLMIHLRIYKILIEKAPFIAFNQSLFKVNKRKIYIFIFCWVLFL